MTTPDPSAAPTRSGLGDLLTYTVPEASAATGLTPRTIRYLIANRRIPVVRLGRTVRLRDSDLRAYLAEHTQPAREDGNR